VDAKKKGFTLPKPIKLLTKGKEELVLINEVVAPKEVKPVTTKVVTQKASKLNA